MEKLHFRSLALTSTHFDLNNSISLHLTYHFILYLEAVWAHGPTKIGPLEIKKMTVIEHFLPTRQRQGQASKKQFQNYPPHYTPQQPISLSSLSISLVLTPPISQFLKNLPSSKPVRRAVESFPDHNHFTSQAVQKC